MDVGDVVFFDMIRTSFEEVGVRDDLRRKYDRPIVAFLDMTCFQVSFHDRFETDY